MMMMMLLIMLLLLLMMMMIMRLTCPLRRIHTAVVISIMAAGMACVRLPQASVRACACVWADGPPEARRAPS